MMNKNNLILTDCESDEIKDFKIALSEELNIEFEIISKICNGKRNFWNRKKYKYIIGWQQFYALFYAFYAKLFHIKKENIVVALNFTYKSKNGIIGMIYKRLMKFVLNNQYLDFIHVPSSNYAKEIAKQFNIPREKFIVIPFGITDKYEIWKNSKCEYNNFTLSIGRSNRDYNFLIDVWKELPKEEKLVIICDEYKPREKLPSNIILRKDVVGDSQFPYIINAKLIIIPIKEKNICSGDTVLLESMSFSKPIAVTIPSTLGEMYLHEGKNGIGIPKEKEKAQKILMSLLKNKEKLEELSVNSRNCFEKNYSRYSMGKNLGNEIKKRS